MTKFRNQEVIANFVNRKHAGCESHTGNLFITGDGKRLVNYATTLAEFVGESDLILVNRTKYSPTTSKIQTWVLSAITSKNMPNYKVEDIPMGARTLDR